MNLFGKKDTGIDISDFDHLEAKTVSQGSVIPLAAGSFNEYMFGYGGYLSNAKAMEFYQTTSSVATAVDMIADAFEQVRPVLRTADNKFIHESPVLDLLNNPNGFNSWRDFAGNISRYYLLCHDSYITAVGNVNSAPVELWPISPLLVNTQQAIDLYPLSFNVVEGVTRGNYKREEKRKSIRFFANSLSELYHIMGFSSRSTELEGDSPLQAASLEAKQLLAGRTHNLSLLNNGSRLSLLVMFKDVGGNDDEQKEAMTRIKEQIVGVENAGGVTALNNADVAEIKEMGMSNKDMDYKSLDEVASISVFMRYKIPLPLVTIKASTFNNLKTGIELLYDQAVLPHADKIFAGLSKFLLPRFKLDPSKVQITYDRESIQALKQRQLDELEQRAKVGIESDNELREFLVGREPYDGGDIHYKPANLIPVGDEIFTDEEPEEGLEE